MSIEYYYFVLDRVLSFFHQEDHFNFQKFYPRDEYHIVGSSRYVAGGRGAARR